MADTSSVKRKPWLKRILIGLGVAVVLLVVGGYVLVPVVAAAKAPGLIEAAAAKSINGTVKVGSVKVGWGGPVIARDVELRDPEGKRVGVFQVESSLGIWKAVGGLSDLGTAKVSGRVDIVRTTEANGTSATNLERALAGRKGSGGGASGRDGMKGGGRVGQLSGVLEVEGVDVTFEGVGAGAVGASGTTGAGRAAMKGLKGRVAFSTVGAGAADATLDAAFGTTLEGAATGSLSIKGSAKGFVKAGSPAVGSASVDATVTAKGAPVGLIDALAGQGGVLAGALGDAADATITVKGPVGALNADIVVTAPNAAADLAVVSEGGRVRVTRKGTVSLRSLAFVERLARVAGALRDSGVVVTRWPGATVTVNALDVPAGGGEGGGVPNWAGAKIDVSALTTGEVVGTVTRPGAGSPEALVVRPIMVGVMAPDVVKGVEVIGNTEASIGGRPAGALDVVLQVTDVIGSDGRLALANGGVPGRIAGKIEARGVASSLLRPVLASAGVPVDAAEDIGPTLDVLVNATTRAGAAGGTASGVPPTDVTLSIRSANVSVAGVLVYDSTGLGLARENEPLRIGVERAAPLLRRVLSKGGSAGVPGPVVSGAGRLELEVVALRVPTTGKTADGSLVSGTVRGAVSDLGVSIPRAGEGARPISVGTERLAFAGTLRPRGVSVLTADGRVAFDGRPAGLRVDVKASGVMEEQDLPRLGGLGTRRLAGVVELKGLAGASVQAVALGGGPGDGLSRAFAELIGPAVDVRLDLGEKTNAGAQALGVTVGGPAVSALVEAELRSDRLEVTRAEGNATVTDALARAVLEMAGQRGEAVPQARLRGPSGLGWKVEQAVSVPLKAETLTPEWSRARSIVAVSAGLSRPAIVDGLRVEGRAVSAGVANCTLNASVPLSIMDEGSVEHTPGAAGLRLAGTMDVVGDDERDVLARLRLDGGSSPGGADARVNVSLADVATGRLDEIVGRGGLLPGLLGDRAAVVASVARVTGPGGQKGAVRQTEIGVDIQSPRLTLNKGRFVVTPDAYAAAAPFSVALEASPQVVEGLLGGKAGEPSVVRVAEPVKLTVNVARLVLSASGEDKGGGPLRPGVFALDAVATSARVVVVHGGGPGREGAAARGGAGPSTTELLDLSAALKSTGSASKTGLEFSASVGSVRGGGAAATEATVVRGTIDDLADAGGNVRTETAVVNLRATAAKLPTALLEAFMSGSGRLTEMVGEEISADIEAREVSKTGTSGFLSARLRSPKAAVTAAGPVAGGVLDTAAPGATPLRIELADFTFQGGGNVLAMFPIFAELHRSAGEANRGPALIASRQLRLPLDGDMRKFSGVLDVDIGRVDYEFSRGLGDFLDTTVFAGGRGDEQRPLPRFTITIDQGVVRYGSVAEKVSLPVRNLDFKMRGVVDLVNKRLDVVTYVPTVAAAPGLVGNLNSTVGGFLGKLVPNAVERFTEIPVRTEGPMGQTTTAYAPQLVLEEGKSVLNDIGRGLVGAPGDIIKGIGDLLGGEKQKPAPKKPPGGPSPGNPPGQPGKPSPPKG